MEDSYEGDWNASPPVFALAPAAHGRRPRLAINEPSEDRLKPARIAMLAARETLAKQTQRESILLPGALGARATPKRPIPVGGCPRGTTKAWPRQRAPREGSPIGAPTSPKTTRWDDESVVERSRTLD